MDLDDRDADEQYYAYLEEPPTCPICDAFGCGGDGGGCYKYEGRGRIDFEDEYYDERF